jgi:Outer membrane protein beta-barrel domain
MTRVARFVGLVALVAVVAPGWAAAKDEKKSDGPLAGVYGQLGPVAGIPAFDLPSTVGQQNGWGMEVRGGYKVLSHLALEGQWQWIARYETTNGQGAQLNVAQTNTFTGNAKVFVFTGPIQPYAILGFGLMNAALKHGPDKTEAALRVGGGSNFFFTDHIGIYGEITYLKPFGSLSTLGSVPIAFGGIYQF